MLKWRVVLKTKRLDGDGKPLTESHTLDGSMGIHVMLIRNRNPGKHYGDWTLLVGDKQFFADGILTEKQAKDEAEKQLSFLLAGLREELRERGNE